MSSYSTPELPAKGNATHQLSTLLRLVGDPTRLRVLTVLYKQGSHCVSECSCHIPDVSQSLLSHHIADLRKAGLVQSDKQGLKVYYSLTDRGQRVMAVVDKLKEGDSDMNGCTCQACPCQNCAC